MRIVYYLVRVIIGIGVILFVRGLFLGFNNNNWSDTGAIPMMLTGFVIGGIGFLIYFLINVAVKGRRSSGFTVKPSANMGMPVTPPTVNQYPQYQQQPYQNPGQYPPQE